MGLLNLICGFYLSALFFQISHWNKHHGKFTQPWLRLYWTIFPGWYGLYLFSPEKSTVELCIYIMTTTPFHEGSPHKISDYLN